MLEGAGMTRRGKSSLGSKLAGLNSRTNDWGFQMSPEKATWQAVSNPEEVPGPDVRQTDQR